MDTREIIVAAACRELELRKALPPNELHGALLRIGYSLDEVRDAIGWMWDNGKLRFTSDMQLKLAK